MSPKYAPCYAKNKISILNLNFMGINYCEESFQKSGQKLCQLVDTRKKERRLAGLLKSDFFFLTAIHWLFHAQSFPFHCFPSTPYKMICWPVKNTRSKLSYAKPDILCCYRSLRTEISKTRYPSSLDCISKLDGMQYIRFTSYFPYPSSYAVKKSKGSSLWYFF